MSWMAPPWVTGDRFLGHLPRCLKKGFPRSSHFVHVFQFSPLILFSLCVPGRNHLPLSSPTDLFSLELCPLGASPSLIFINRLYNNIYPTDGRQPTYTLFGTEEIFVFQLAYTTSSLLLPHDPFVNVCLHGNNGPQLRSCCICLPPALVDSSSETCYLKVPLLYRGLGGGHGQSCFFSRTWVWSKLYSAFFWEKG